MESVDDAPTGSATASLADGTEDTAYVVSETDLLQGFSDADGDPLSVSDLVSSSGTVTDNGDGTYTIAPVPDYSGPVTLSYSVIEPSGGSVLATQSFNLMPTNDAPVAVTDHLTISEDAGQVRIEVLSNDYDVDGDELQLQGSVTNFFGHVNGVDVDGEAVISDDRKAILFTPDPDSHGLAMLRYTVGDGDEYSGRMGGVYITVESVYDPVVARNDGVVIGSELGEGDEQSLAATIDVLRNDGTRRRWSINHWGRH